MVDLMDPLMETLMVVPMISDGLFDCCTDGDLEVWPDELSDGDINSYSDGDFDGLSNAKLNGGYMMSISMADLMDILIGKLIVIYAVDMTFQYWTRQQYGNSGVQSTINDWQLILSKR